MKEYHSHRYADIFPLRGGSSLIELSDSIAAVGQCEEIVLYERQVLDGRRRQAAAIRAGKTPRYREFGSRPGDGDSALEFSFAVNFHRRDDMSEAEKTLAAVAYANMKIGDNQHSKEATTNVGASQKEAAKKFGVNAKQVERAKAVMTHGTPELQDAMKAEKVSISDASSIVDESPDVQRQAVKDVESGTSKTLKGAVEAMTGPVPETPAMIARDLDRLIQRLTCVQTSQVQARELAVQGLRGVLALVGKL